MAPIATKSERIVKVVQVQEVSYKITYSKNAPNTVSKLAKPTKKQAKRSSKKPTKKIARPSRNQTKKPTKKRAMKSAQNQAIDSRSKNKTKSKGKSKTTTNIITKPPKTVAKSKTVSRLKDSAKKITLPSRIQPRKASSASTAQSEKPAEKIILSLSNPLSFYNILPTTPTPTQRHLILVNTNNGTAPLSFTLLVTGLNLLIVAKVEDAATWEGENYAEEIEDDGYPFAT